MVNRDILKNKLRSINGQDYGAYQSLIGEYDFSRFKLVVQQIPKDPYAPPHTSIYRVQVQRNEDQVINLKMISKIQEIAFRDFLARRFYNASLEVSKGRRGTGYSGIITINQPGQCVLERSSVVVNDHIIEVRCFLGLPASGRKINAEIAEEMLLNELVEIVNLSLFKENLDMDTLHQHVDIVEDAEYLRTQLETLGLVSFIANDAVLPRESGISDKPMRQESVVRFCSPESLKIDVKLPHAGLVTGMGIPRGVTLIAGGGYHGKSTLLKVIESGIYNHIPNDGREKCVSLPQTVKVRSYSGRYIVNTDISPFIKNLPFSKDTTSFTTENASGSTSQAANIIEAMEVGAEILLMDEDTCATNFMIRDYKMQQLVSKDDEPITAFIDKVRQLYVEKNISTILVLGGAGDYFDVADQVIQMKQYKPLDVTHVAHQISEKSPEKRIKEDEDCPFSVRDRIPLPESINPYNEYGKKGIYASEVNRLTFGGEIIDLTDLEQLIELSQTKAIGYALDYARKYMDENASLKEIVAKVMNDIKEKGLDILSDRISGHFAWFRGLELAFAFNRLRGADVIQRKPG
ncbi:ABC-ATPase domain-containing protein [bacterium]|nr:ABC-ATPase domain-containing protein [bacterium]